MMKKTWLTPSMISLVVAYGVLYVWQPGGVRVLGLVTDALSVLFALLASFLAVRARQMFEPGSASRRAWLFFGLGMAAMTAAEFLWAYYHDVLVGPLPFPSPADVLWAISYVLLLVSFILQYRALGVQASPRRKLSVAALYGGVLISALAVSVGPAFSRPGQVATLDLLINAYYLVGDLSIGFIATLSLLFLWNGLVSRPWQYILTSVLLFVIADLTFSYGSANDLYATGSNWLSGVVDVAYLAAYVIAAAGGYRQITLHLPA
ncbi:MAG TPA: hypothetical protein VLG46_01580 [Anaerolineae bacterium]|nr:hypothetical protein [Anaerolineae bacterium]